MGSKAIAAHRCQLIVNTIIQHGVARNRIKFEAHSHVHAKSGQQSPDPQLVLQMRILPGSRMPSNNVQNKDRLTREGTSYSGRPWRDAYQRSPSKELRERVRQAKKNKDYQQMQQIFLDAYDGQTECYKIKYTEIQSLIRTMKRLRKEPRIQVESAAPPVRQAVQAQRRSTPCKSSASTAATTCSSPALSVGTAPIDGSFHGDSTCATIARRSDNDSGDETDGDSGGDPEDQHECEEEYQDQDEQPCGVERQMSDYDWLMSTSF